MYYLKHEQETRSALSDIKHEATASVFTVLYLQG
jgi:hypothetical protein